MKIIKKITTYLPAIITGIAVTTAVFFIHYGTLAINHRVKEAGIALPMPTIVAIAFSKYHIYTAMAISCLFTIGLVEWKFKEKQKKLAVEVYMISVFLVLTALTFFAMAIPFACLCDAWKQW